MCRSAGIVTRDTTTLFYISTNTFRCNGYLLRVGLKCRRKHIGEQLQSYGEQEFHEGNDDEDEERDQAKEVGADPKELQRKR